MENVRHEDLALKIHEGSNQNDDFSLEGKGPEQGSENATRQLLPPLGGSSVSLGESHDPNEYNVCKHERSELTH